MTKDPKPGEWTGLEGIPICEDWENFKEPAELELEVNDGLIALYSLFKEKVYNPKSVLYPLCGFDSSAARVFDNVTFVDIEHGSEGCIKKLQEAGFKALKQDIRDYKPLEAHDLLLLLNPAIPAEWATQHIVKGAYIIANNYHGSAKELANKPGEFDLVYATLFIPEYLRKGEYKVKLLEDLSGFFEPVKDAEEFKKLRPEDFEFVKQQVEDLVSRGIVQSDPSASFDEKWAAFREYLKIGMPAKMTADYFIFTKK